ncbi:MAG: prevent-host-death family protein [Alphaproteobacteria bacterium 16-39-46]|nr:MAG: prevent-host-death family protein [Alphaproteobacteria bacterium 16-39-46]OZA41749.1 MAG: prevent-host-death family protein [Alphaproteobacteria bacterium 17-39-52]HQS84747.1 type II toxin-antitoxin system Phd/YefM family antitoxin [Alphaproteobacteria bacterium]HQS94557.1 type II toxin-antitoxin system Phd/YefM family antitoxin [Alphaproteobacteria bacterium]
MNISATELNKHSGRVLNMALKEPVIIQKNKYPIAVILSYERFKELEDVFWGKDTEATKINATWLSADESLNFLKS